MKYTVTSDKFIETDEAEGTIQNLSGHIDVELSDDGAKNTGIILKPRERFSWTGGALQVRSLNGSAEVAVIPFESGGKGGGGGEGTGVRGPRGYSAYDIAVRNGFVGTETEWLQSLEGQDGAKGVKGDKGEDGEDGVSPTVNIVNDLTNGTHTLTITDKNGTKTATIKDGTNGKSAYEIAVSKGYVGTETEWVASLKGEKGDDGEDGFDPKVTLTENSKGKYTMSITNKNGSSNTTLNFYGGLVYWTPNTNYAKEDLVVYNGVLYEVTADFTSGTTFDDTNLESYVGKQMVGATSADEGEGGLVPAPSIAARDKFLRGDGAWATPAGGSATTESGVYATRTVLWEGKAYQKGQTVTLSDTYTNYDYIIAYGSNSEVGIIHKSDTRMRLSGHGFSGESFRGTFINFSGTTATLESTQNFNQDSVYVKRIEGIKFTANPNDYSTTEKVIGTWIDGKPLYQKVWTGTIVQGGVLQLSGIDKVVSFEGYIYSSSLIIPINFNTTMTEGNFTGMWAQQSSSGQVTFSYEASYSHYKNVPAIITLKYTKL